jgi:hypothetical protein
MSYQLCNYTTFIILVITTHTVVSVAPLQMVVFYMCAVRTAWKTPVCNVVYLPTG